MKCQNLGLVQERTLQKVGGAPARAGACRGSLGRWGSFMGGARAELMCPACCPLLPCHAALSRSQLTPVHAPCTPCPLQLLPIVPPNQSDSGSFDGVLELLVRFPGFTAVYVNAAAGRFSSWWIAWHSQAAYSNITWKISSMP